MRCSAPVEGGVTASREFAVAGLTAQIGDMVVPVGAVADEGMHVRIRN